MVEPSEGEAVRDASSGPVIDLAQEWIAIDPDDETRQEIATLLETENYSELNERLNSRIAFGTAGLRGRMEAGYSRMNSLTVIQTSRGLAAYLLENIPDAKSRGVVIGRDARRNSAKFEEAAARAFAAMGIRVYRYRDPVHTPLVPFSVGYLEAAAGVMITASHNPKEDNGYKVYWENGCQIIPPIDYGIAKSILQHLEPKLAQRTDDNLRHYLNNDIPETYRAKISGVIGFESNIPKFVYTPLHGVGFAPFSQTVATLPGGFFPASNGGVPNLFHVVQKQRFPDPDFPTVVFPNPEERGALDLAMRTADEEGVKLILANDPDADRLAVAEKTQEQDGSEAIGQTDMVEKSYWHQFSGNQVGILLAAYLLEEKTLKEDLLTTRHFMLRSAVSSEMLDTMAASHGVQVQETLTGFKWLGNVAKDIGSKNGRVLFAFEEALGYMIPDIVYDKDGVSAGALFLVAAASWRKRSSMTPWQKLQQLYRKHGYFAEANTYLKCPSPEIAAKIFADIRALETPYPSKFMDTPIDRWRDLTKGYDSSTADKKPVLPVDVTSQMITFWMKGRIRVTARGSGTEPKIKIYIETHDSESMERAQKEVDVVKTALVEHWFSPQKYGLTLAA